MNKEREIKLPETIDEAKERLAVIGVAAAQNNRIKLAADKVVSASKEEIKAIFNKFDMKEYKDDNCSISMSMVDKSYLDNTKVLKYLKEHNLEKYIVVTESFDTATIIMAMQNGELDASDFAGFKVEKFESRLTLK